MNTENSKTGEAHRFRLNLTDKLNLKSLKRTMALANLNVYYNSEDIKSKYNNNKFKISAPTWNDIFNFPDGSYSISDIQDYFEFIKKTWPLTENPPVQIYFDLYCFPKKKNGIKIRIANSWKNEIIRKQKKRCW